MPRPDAREGGRERNEGDGREAEKGGRKGRGKENREESMLKVRQNKGRAGSREEGRGMRETERSREGRKNRKERKEGGKYVEGKAE